MCAVCGEYSMIKAGVEEEDKESEEREPTTDNCVLDEYNNTS